MKDDLRRWHNPRRLTWLSAMALAIFLLTGCSDTGQMELSSSDASAKVHYLPDVDAFRKVMSENDQLLVFDFYAEWCKYCKALDVILKDISKTYAGRVGFYQIDIDRNTEFARSMGMRSVPYVVFIKNRAVVKSLHGLFPKQVYLQTIEQLI